MVDEQALRRLAEWRETCDLDEVNREIARHNAEVKQLQAVKREALASIDVFAGPLDDLERRFWSKVQVVDDDASCWEWGGATRGVEGERYGSFRCEVMGVQTSNAHRVAYFLATGEWPTVTRHTCDNPPCVRPSHLVNGTHAENMRDRHERGRYGKPREQRGEANAIAVLTEDVVRQARTLYREGLSYARIGALFGVKAAAIGFAVRGQTWGHVTDPPPLQDGEARRGGAKLTEPQRIDILLLRAQGASLGHLARLYGVTESAIGHLCRKHGVSPL